MKKSRLFDFHLRRWRCFLGAILASFLLASNVGAASPSGTSSRLPATSASVKFPAYVAAAMAVAAEHTNVPILGPLWLPTHAAGGSLMRPKNGTFAAIVKTSKRQYTMQFWREPHPLPVNNPEVVQDSTDSAVEPLATVTGVREPSRLDARDMVLKNGLDGFNLHGTLLHIPVNAQYVAITTTISGEVWIRRLRTRDPYSAVIAWHEHGWLLVTESPLVYSTPRQAVASAVKTASTLISKVMAPMPGQLGTIWIDQGGDGEHTTAMWQRGKLVYSVFANYGLSPATTVVGSLYPAGRCQVVLAR